MKVLNWLPEQGPKGTCKVLETLFLLCGLQFQNALVLASFWRNSSSFERCTNLWNHERKREERCKSCCHEYQCFKRNLFWNCYGYIEKKERFCHEMYLSQCEDYRNLLSYIYSNIFTIDFTKELSWWVNWFILC